MDRWSFLAGCVGLLACGPEPQTPTQIPSPGSSAAQASPIQFVDESVERGVDLLHAANRSEGRFLPEVMGAGVAVADFDRDGALDLYLVGGGDLSNSKRSSNARDRLYLNDGAGNFRDASDEWNVHGTAYGMGVACGDFDNDGWVDVVLTTYGGGERLLRNTGTGGFEDVSVAAGMQSKRGWGTGAGFFDYDGDGDLDIYITRYVEYDHRTVLPCRFNGRHTYCSPGLYTALSDTLWRNNGDGTFEDVSVAAGIASHPGKGLAICLGDVDWDGDVDVYVANDITRNLLFMNDGAGAFEERGRTSGVAYDETGRAASGMGADMSDVDDNGLQDLSCTNYQEETTNIFLQQPLGVFRDRSYVLGVGSSGQQRLSFGIDFFDFDNDGDEDLIVGNGHVDDGIGEVSNITFAQQNSLFQLDENGHFNELSNVSGAAMRDVHVTRGVASGDLDGDGLLDMVLTNNAGPVRLLMNRSAVAGQGAVVLWLEGRRSNRSAIGARLEIQTDAGELRREVRGASSYLSQCDTRVHIGLGEQERTGAIAVLWPSGERQDLAGLVAGFYHLVEGSEPVAFVPGAATMAPR